MTMTATPRLPFDPIEARIPRHRAGGPHMTHGPHNWYGLKGLSRQHGVRRATLYNWRNAGVPLRSADRAAELVGCHPVDLWGSEYYAAWEQYEQSVSPETRRLWAAS